VTEKWSAKYRGKFDAGWDVYRDEVFARQKALGVVPEDAVLTERNEAFPAWDSLSADERRLYARQMEVYAGYQENADYNVVRVLETRWWCTGPAASPTRAAFGPSSPTSLGWPARRAWRRLGHRLAPPGFPPGRQAALAEAFMAWLPAMEAVRASVVRGGGCDFPDQTTRSAPSRRCVGCPARPGTAAWSTWSWEHERCRRSPGRTIEPWVIRRGGIRASDRPTVPVRRPWHRRRTAGRPPGDPP
jgi:hypothetical protein